MTQQLTWKELKNLLTNRVGIPADQLEDDPGATFEALGLDSLAYTNVLIALQQQYGFRIPDEDAQQLRTPDQVLAYTNRRLEGKG